MREVEKQLHDCFESKMPHFLVLSETILIYHYQKVREQVKPIKLQHWQYLLCIYFIAVIILDKVRCMLN